MITNHPSFGPFPALSCVVVFIHLMAGISSAATVSVSTVSELQSALNSADPGDVIEASDGTYALSSDLSITRSGTTNAPIVVKAQNKLQSEITGNGRIMFDKVSNVKFEGFYITIDADQGGVFWRGIIHVEDCNNVRICYNHLKLNEVSSTVGNWIGILGYTGQSHHNRIDHNLFQDKTFMGDFVMIGGGSTGNAYGSEYDRIDHNHFSNFVYSAANGYETIRIGSNSDGNISRDYYTIIEDNLFEKCSGEGELFSLKCGSCTVRRNTFVDSYGAVCLRGGNGHIVNGNYFIRKDGGERRGGIKIYGTDHLVFNNYFENLNGFSDTSSLVIKSGYPAGSGLAGGADAIAASNVMVVFNSWVNCRPIEIGSPNYSNAPSDCVIANNILYGNHENRSLVKFRDDVLNFVYAGNIIYPTGGSSTFEFADGATPVTFTQDEFREVDPQMTDSGDMYRLTNSGSAIDYATGTYSFVTNDIEGHSRGALKDVGADEYSTAPPARTAALSPEDVGPWAEEIPDPDDPDNDHDGIPDAWEIQYGLNPTNAADASQDADSDGAINVGEYVAGTDPTNPASIFMLNAPVVGGAGNILNWASVSSRIYSVYWATNLLGTNAFSLMTNNLPATPELNVYTDEVYSAEQTIFYSINVKIEE